MSAYKIASWHCYNAFEKQNAIATTRPTKQLKRLNLIAKSGFCCLFARVEVLPLKNAKRCKICGEFE